MLYVVGKSIEFVRYIMEVLSKEQIKTIFAEIDKDNDGFISRQDLQSTDFALSLFNNDPQVLNSFHHFPNSLMNLEDFILIAQAIPYKLQEFVYAKFQFEKQINKYLLVSAPGETAPSVKQSYIRLRAFGGEEKDVQHSLCFEVGVDKPHQQEKIKEVSEALGHKPHEVFLMLKIKSNSNGEQIAAKLNELASNLLELVQGVAMELEELLKGLRINAKYYNGYIYLVVELDNSVVDDLVRFAVKVLESVSPQCAFKFKAKLASDLSNLLSGDFDYSKSGGEVVLEFDIDNVTLKKIKEVLGDLVAQGQITPENQVYSLLFEQLKLNAEFNNLGQALSSTFQINPQDIPKPAAHAAMIQGMGIKETVGQFTGQGPNIITLLNQSCQAEGELSLNLHDFFIKVNFDIHIKNAFDLLS